MELAKGALENNLAQKRYRNEEFIASLAAIPDEYYGGTDKKKRELTRLFRSYDEAKFAHLTAAGSFPEVTASAANSLRAYKQASIQADWLVALLERYAKEEIRSAIRQDDLPAFIALAKAYREIRDVLPSRSEALDQIDRYISSKLRQAERYVDARQYEKAIELYRELNALEDTSTLIAEAESRWVDNEPVRLLREKYPDKAYRFVMSGESLWGSQVYAVGLTEDDDPQLYLAAKMPDGNVLYLEKSVGSGVAPSKLSLSEALGEKEAPLIFLEAQGKERTYLYTGFAPDLFSSRLAKVFEIEGEGFAAENPELIIVDNPTGEGEGQIAFFKLEEKGLVYEGKKDDYLSETAEGEDNASGKPETMLRMSRGKIHLKIPGTTRKIRAGETERRRPAKHQTALRPPKKPRPISQMPEMRSRCTQVLANSMSRSARFPRTGRSRFSRKRMAGTRCRLKGKKGGSTRFRRDAFLLGMEERRDYSAFFFCSVAWLRPYRHISPYRLICPSIL